MFWQQITVKEVNRHLNKVIEELTAKHGGVSSPEFERELELRTGIKWKQVKNYRNHPTPNQVLRENSKVKEFVLASRRQNFAKNFFKQALAVSTILIVLIVVSVRVYRSAHREIPITASHEPKTISLMPQVSLEPKIKLTIPDLNVTLQLGKIGDPIKKLKWTTCSDFEVRTCMLSIEPSNIAEKFDLTTRERKGDIFAITLTTGKRQTIVSLKKQLDEQIKGFTGTAGSWKIDNETLTTGNIQVPNGSNKSELFTVTLSHQYPI